MDLVVMLLGVCIASLGVVGIVSPPRILAIVGGLQSQIGLYFVAGIRLALGVVLLLAAPASRAPGYLQVIGVLALISGIVTPFFGLRRFEELLRWWREQPPSIVRIWCAFVVLFGSSFVWAVLPALVGD